MLLLYYILSFAGKKNTIHCISYVTLPPGPPLRNNIMSRHITIRNYVHKRQLRAKKDYWTPDVGVEPTALRLKV